MWSEVFWWLSGETWDICALGYFPHAKASFTSDISPWKINLIILHVPSLNNRDFLKKKKKIKKNHSATRPAPKCWEDIFHKGGRKQLPDVSCSFCTVLPECPSTWRHLFADSDAQVWSFLQTHVQFPCCWEFPWLNTHGKKKKRQVSAILDTPLYHIPLTIHELFLLYARMRTLISFCWKTINPFVPNEWIQY